MAAQVGGPRGDKLVGKFGNQHEDKRQVRQEAVAQIEAEEDEMKLSDEEDDEEEQEEAGGIDADGLAQGAVEQGVELAVTPHFDHARIGGNFGGSPAVGERLDAREGGERHAHLTGNDGAVGGEKNGIEKLEDEIAANPTDGYLPLERKNLREVRNALHHFDLINVAKNATKRGDGEGCDGYGNPREAVNARREQFGSEAQAAPYDEEAERNLEKAVFGHLFHLAETFEKGEHRGYHEVERRRGAQNEPRQFPIHGASAAVVAREEDVAHDHQDEEKQDGKETIPAKTKMEEGGKAGAIFGFTFQT